MGIFQPLKCQPQAMKLVWIKSQYPERPTSKSYAAVIQASIRGCPQSWVISCSKIEFSIISHQCKIIKGAIPFGASEKVATDLQLVSVFPLLGRVMLIRITFHTKRLNLPKNGRRVVQGTIVKNHLFFN